MKPNGDKDPISLETLREIADQHSFCMRPEDEEGYLAVLHATQESVAIVDALPDYIDPELLPAPGPGETASPRTYVRPPKADNPLNAWMFKTNIQASGATGPLSGRTVAIKDNVSVAGVPTTCGTQPGHLTSALATASPYPIPSLDAPIVSRILAAGAMVPGTSTCENYCTSAMSCTSATGPVENPWLKGYSAGGSSGGSAALIAVNIVRRWRQARGLPELDLGEGVDMAVGGDQGGSIRVPASYCGIYGLKPTHGLVPYTGIAGLLPMIDHTGPMAASVRDTALLLSVVAGYDNFDPRMGPQTPLRPDVPQYHELLDAEVASRKGAGTWNATSAARGLRIGILKEAFEAPGMDASVAAVVRKAASRFRDLGAASVDEISIPQHSLAPHIFTAATRTYMADAALRQVLPTTLSFPFPGGAPRQLDQAWYETMTQSNPLVPALLLTSKALRNPAVYSEAVRHKAIRHVHGLRAAYDRVLEDYDVLVMPTTPTVGLPHAADDMSVAEKCDFLLSNTVNTLPFNITGHPGLNVPVGWGKARDSNDMLPIGMQFVARRFNEQKLFLAAAAWEVGGLGLDEEL
ncbi:amidase signature enzyme [Xylariaceae sp. FL1651]|nr:amidase signature enzyme [Xylariaceae sp. FL1651]